MSVHAPFATCTNNGAEKLFSLIARPLVAIRSSWSQPLAVFEGINALKHYCNECP